MNNEIRYFIVNGDVVLGFVFYHPEFGRSIVIIEKPDSKNPIAIMDREGNKIEENYFVEFIAGMLPN